MTENATTTIVAVKYQKTAPHHTMNKEGWEKEFDEKFPIHYFETNIISPEQIKTFITEQRRRAKEEAVEYIKLHSPKLHATGGYEVKNEILDEATREGE